MSANLQNLSTGLYLQNLSTGVYLQNLSTGLYLQNLSTGLYLQNLATGLEKVSFHSSPKERQSQRMVKLGHNCTHLTH